MILKLQLRCLVLMIGAFAVFSFSGNIELASRDPYTIELPKIAVSVDETTGVCNRVRITFYQSDDYVIISEFDDTYVKTTRNGTEKTVYRESMEKSYQLTNFEVEQINKVCKSFIDVLETYEKNLQNERWGRCLFLDAYLPNFLSGFYYLMLVARNSSENVPIEAKISEKLYDVSLNSAKSDERIKKWRTTSDHIVHLRIATKELIFQIKAWQKKELTNQKRDLEIPQDTDFYKSLIFFEKMYFN